MVDAISSRVEQLAREDQLADGTPCRTISVSRVAQLAEEAQVSGRRVEIIALEKGILPDRYLRNYRSLSTADQIRLLNSSVCIVGLGGLGGLVTETLARMGVGRLTLIDGDRFEAHNLNRQLLSRSDGLGKSKARAAAKRVAAINPGIETKTVPEFLNASNAPKLMADCDLAVDCLDNIQSRLTLAAAARRAGMSMVSAAVGGLSGHITTIFPQDKGLENIYGPIDQLKADKGEEVRLGNLAPAVNLMASLECAEVLKVLLAREHNLQNRMLVVDLSDYTLETLQLA